MLRRERGYGKATDKEFKMYLSPVGAPLPPNIPEDDPELKPALSMALWSPSFGDAVMTTCGAIVRTAVNAMWTRYRSFREASDGLLPIITFGEAHEIEVAKRAFQAPQIDITGWVKRETIPSFALLPPTVSPPPPVDAQIGFSAIPAITTKAKHKPPKAGTLRDMLDDKIPDLES
jgi:hypothetical protein